MFILFLASAVSANAAVPAAAPRDIQQVAIDAITGTSRLTPVAKKLPTETRRPVDPQTEIVNRITSRNVTYPAPSGRTGRAGDPQAAIVRAITGRN